MLSRRIGDFFCKYLAIPPDEMLLANMMAKPAKYVPTPGDLDFIKYVQKQKAFKQEGKAKIVEAYILGTSDDLTGLSGRDIDWLKINSKKFGVTRDWKTNV